MHLRGAVLEGTAVRLEPLAPHHRDEMRETLACDPENWSIQLNSPLGDRFGEFWTAMLSSRNRISYAVRDLGSERLAGTSSFIFIDAFNRSLEVGATWLRPEFRGTVTNPEMKLLMLDHAFAAGAHRVQFTVDTRNRRSQNAMLKLGATLEGVIRNHRITWTGHVRSSALFSILAEEWPAMRSSLTARLLAADPAARPSQEQWLGAGRRDHMWQAGGAPHPRQGSASE